MENEKIRIAVLASGSGTNLQAIMDACNLGTIPGEVVVVGSDKPGVGALKRAEKAGIPTFVVDYLGLRQKYLNREIEWPEDYNAEDAKAKMGAAAERLGKYNGYDRAIAEAELLKQLAVYKPDLLVLAGFMWVLTPYFIDKFNRSEFDLRIVNIHPALLPCFPGKHGYDDSWKYGVRVYGCTVHFVDYGEDTGPIIGQSAGVRRANMTFEDYKDEGLKREWRLYADCVELFAKGRLRVLRNESGRKVVEVLD